MASITKRGTVGKPEQIWSRGEFLSRISAHFSRARPINAEHAARAVFQVLENHVSAGEIREVMEELPREIRSLWPERQPAPQALSDFSPR